MKEGNEPRRKARNDKIAALQSEIVRFADFYLPNLDHLVDGGRYKVVFDISWQES